MNKFLKIIKEAIPGSNGIQGGTGIQTKPIPAAATKPAQQPTQPPRSSMHQIGGAMRKVGSGFNKIKTAIGSVKEFSKNGDFSVLKDLGQQLLNKYKDVDTYKISLFGHKGYEKVTIIDKDLITKIGLQKVQQSNESVKIIKSSGLINQRKFIGIINEAGEPNEVQPTTPEFTFNITAGKNLGNLGKQYTLTPVAPELQQHLNTNNIKFVTFLRDHNTPQEENLFGNITFDNNGGKLQFYDMNNSFIPRLETPVRFEYSPQDKSYKIGAKIASHSFADIEDAERLLKMGVMIIYPLEKLFELPSRPKTGSTITFKNKQTKQAFTGTYTPSSSPDKKLAFIIMSNVKPAEDITFSDKPLAQTTVQSSASVPARQPRQSPAPQPAQPTKA